MKTGDRRAGISRRTVVQGAAAASATSLLGFLGCDKAAPPPARPGDATAALELGFTPVPTSRADAVVVPARLPPAGVERVGRSGGLGRAPAFSPTPASGAAQARRPGMGHDGMAFFPLPPAPTASEHGLLAINYEYTDDSLLTRTAWSRGPPRRSRKSKNAHGVGIIEVRLEGGSWRVVPGSRYGRRITADTPFALRGPGGGARLDEDRGRPRRARPCAARSTTARPAGRPGGRTSPARRTSRRTSSTTPARSRACTTATASPPEKDSWGFRWQEFDPRFDAARHPNEPNRHGWVVEVDPYDPKSHAREAHRAGPDGARGRDGGRRARRPRGRLHGRRRLPLEVRAHLQVRQPRAVRAKGGGRATNRDILDEGTLYAARFDADGTGDWMRSRTARTGSTPSARLRRRRPRS